MRRFVALAAIISIPYILFAAAMTVRDRNAAHANAELQQSASDIAEHLNRDLTALQDSLAALAASAPVRLGDEAGAIEIIRKVVRQERVPISLTLSVQQAVAVAPAGNAISYGPVARSLLPDLQTALLRHTPVVTDMQPDIADGAAGLAVIVPVDGAAPGRASALVAILSAGRLVGISTASPLRSVIVDRDGNALLGPNGAFRPKADHLAGMVQSALRQDVGYDGVLHVVMDGTPTVMASGHRSFGGLSATVAIPEGKFAGATGPSLITTYAVGALALLTSLACIWLLPRRWSVAGTDSLTEAVRAANADLEQRVQREMAAREVVRQRAAQADRVQALGQLAGGIAHDFNNILQAIAGSAALIGRHPENRDLVSRFATIIGESAARGAAITRRVLLLARRGDLKAEPIDPNALLSGVKDVFVYTLGPSITVKLEVAEDLPCFMADKMQLEIALVNLATNARDAMPNGGTLRLRADIDELSSGTLNSVGLLAGCYVRLSLTDTGIGMSEAMLARVGEPFFTTKEIGKGTGLGLSMVKGFADQSGGGFSIESKLGEGTTARIWLPIAGGQAVSLRGAAAFADGVAQILLVDDDPHARDTVSEQLEELGHIVLSAAGGSDALAILRAREAIDLMITDLSMPGMDGLALIQQARGVRPRLPAILLTGYTSDATALTRDQEPPQQYTLIPKPASTATLRARIRELLQH